LDLRLKHELAWVEGIDETINITFIGGRHQESSISLGLIPICHGFSTWKALCTRVCDDSSGNRISGRAPEAR
jgi:hypothetical protein